MNKEYQILVDIISENESNRTYKVSHIENNIIYFKFFKTLKDIEYTESGYTFNLNNYYFYHESCIINLGNHYKKELLILKRKLKLKSIQDE